MRNELTTLQKEKKDIMRGLHEVYGFNFEKPYRVAKVCGATTVKKLENAVCADKGDVVVALVVDGSAHGCKYYSAVELSPYYKQGFDIERAKGIYHTKKNIKWNYSFSYFVRKADFNERRIENDSEIIVIAQSVSHFFKNADSEKYMSRCNNMATPKSIGRRYEIVEIDKDRYSTSITARERDVNSTRTCYMCTNEDETIYDCIDKSGYLVREYRKALHKRSEERKAELKRAEVMKHDYTDRVTTLREILKMKRDSLADDLRNATTSKEMEKVRDNLSYWHGLLDLMRDFEEFEENVNNKSFASVEACDALYNRIMKNAMESR